MGKDRDDDREVVNEGWRKVEGRDAWMETGDWREVKTEREREGERLGQKDRDRDN